MAGETCYSFVLARDNCILKLYSRSSGDTIVRDSSIFLFHQVVDLIRKHYVTNLVLTEIESLSENILPFAITFFPPL